MVNLLPKGERMPQTPEQFAEMANKYEKALLREKELNSYYQERINRLEQKIKALTSEINNNSDKIINFCLYHALATSHADNLTMLIDELLMQTEELICK